MLKCNILKKVKALKAVGKNSNLISICNVAAATDSTLHFFNNSLVVDKLQAVANTDGAAATIISVVSLFLLHCVRFYFHYKVL